MQKCFDSSGERCCCGARSSLRTYPQKVASLARNSEANSATIAFKSAWGDAERNVGSGASAQGCKVVEDGCLHDKLVML